MLGKKIGMDLGTASVRMVVKGEGILVSEPSVVAVPDGDPGAALAGAAALEAASRETVVRLYRPLQGGAVADPVAARALILALVTRAVGRQRIFKPDVVLAVMSGLPGDQRRLLLEAAMVAGARTAYLLDSSIAAALGAGLPLAGSAGHLVIDIGAGKTDVAVLALEGTVASRCLSGHGGQRLTASVAQHVERRHGVKLSARGAEDIVESLARAGAHEERRMVASGGDDDGDRTVELTSTEFTGCIDAHVRPIADAVTEVLDEIPPSLREDVRLEGGVLCGGGALLEHLDTYLGASCGLTLRRDGDPLLSTVRGTGYASDNLDVLKRNFMYIR